MTIQIEDWGINVPIREALEKQTDYWAERVYNDVPDKIIFVEHMPVYTAGAQLTYSFSPEKIAEHFKCPLHELRCPIEYTRRGGLVTYQGPGILSVYCVFGFAKYSVKDFMEVLLTSAEALLQKYGILTVHNCNNPGLYIGNNKKIVSFGIQISRGVTRFGMTISLNPEEKYLEPLIPCGLKGITMTSLSTELGRTNISSYDKLQIKTVLALEIQKLLNKR